MSYPLTYLPTSATEWHLPTKATWAATTITITIAITAHYQSFRDLKGIIVYSWFGSISGKNVTG